VFVALAASEIPDKEKQRRKKVAVWRGTYEIRSCGSGTAGILRQESMVSQLRVHRDSRVLITEAITTIIEINSLSGKLRRGPTRKQLLKQVPPLFFSVHIFSFKLLNYYK